MCNCKGHISEVIYIGSHATECTLLSWANDVLMILMDSAFSVCLITAQLGVPLHIANCDDSHRPHGKLTRQAISSPTLIEIKADH